MELSAWGTKMAALSGIRSIMEDIAVTSTGADSGEWLNLSPGNPAAIPEAAATWQRLEQEAVADGFAAASGRYGPSRGTDGLVQAIVRYFNQRYGWGISAQNVLVGPGSQLLCFIATTIFTGPHPGGNRKLVLPATPDYTGYQGLNLEPGGIAGLPSRIVREDNRHFHYALEPGPLRQGEPPGMMLLSSPSNPACRSITAGELAELVSIAEAYDIPLVVDNAYGEPFPTITASSARPVHHPNVINCFTLSKAGLAGERIGFAIGGTQPISAMLSFLANCALHAPQLIQAVVARALDSGELDTLTASIIRPYYVNKRRSAEKLLEELLPSSIRWRLHSSDGGMFCWLWIDEPWFDDLTMYEEMKRRKVFIVPGRHFFVPSPEAPPDEHSTRCIRLSLSADESVIAEGTARLARALEQMSHAQ